MREINLKNIPRYFLFPAWFYHYIFVYTGNVSVWYCSRREHGKRLKSHSESQSDVKVDFQLSRNF